MSSLVATLAWRYVRGRRSVLLNGTARAALLSTSIGVTTMVVAMALMTGYSEDLQRKLIGGNAGIVAYALDRSRTTAEQRAQLAALPGVVSVEEVAYGQGSISTLDDPRPLDITLRGVDRTRMADAASAAARRGGRRHADRPARARARAPPRRRRGRPSCVWSRSTSRT